jgi:hypothetical protein
MKRSLSFTLFAVAFGACAPDAKAVINKIDPFTFCNNTCHAPSCNQPSIAEQCKKECGDDNIWKHVASLQMSSSSKDFRTEKDKKKKDGMLYDTPIAKCLGKEKSAEEPSEADAKLKADLEAAIKAKADAEKAMEAEKKKNALCTTALHKAMTDFKSDETTLESQKREIESEIDQLKGGNQQLQQPSRGEIAVPGTSIKSKS